MADRAPRLLARELGPVTIVVLVAAYAGLWALARPAGEDTGSYIGQAFGAVAVLLFSIALILISTLPWVESWFDGIDRAAIWHRRMAITGLVLLAAHIPLSSSPIHTRLGGPLGAIGAWGMVGLALWAILPRWQSVVPRPLRGSIRMLKDAPVIRDVRKIFGGYDRWRQVHRLTGVLVGAAFSILLAGEFFATTRLSRFELPVLMLLATLGMMLMVSAGNFLSLYMGLELQSLAL